MKTNLLKKRIHDNFYLKEKRILKDSQKFLIKNLDLKKFNGSLIDVGCATGVFLDYVARNFKNINTYGQDINIKLINQAKKYDKKTKFFCSDISIEKKNKLCSKKFDIIILDGVHPIFDDLHIVVKNLVKMSKKNTRIIIYGSVNENDYDVFVAVRNIKKKIFESGWNRFSIKTIEKIFSKYSFIMKKKLKFQIKKNILKNVKDPRRTYTVTLNNKKRLTINGLELISTPYYLEFSK
jgi:2-polyprenyl-3-methyl-5-hydroxy-6-metoxy-1,4-benzoquinol methylase